MPKPKEKRKVQKDVCRKEQGIAEPGNTCLETPGTCESCPNWWKRKKADKKPQVEEGYEHFCERCGTEFSYNCVERGDRILDGMEPNFCPYCGKRWVERKKGAGRT